MPLTRLPLTTGVSGTLAAGNGGTGVTSADEIGNFVKLASTTASSASNVDFNSTTFSTDYKMYKIIIQELTVSTDSALEFLVSNDNGSTFDNSSNQYTRAMITNDHTDTNDTIDSRNQALDGASMTVVQTISANSEASANFQLDIYGFNQTGKRLHFFCHGVYRDNSNSNRFVSGSAQRNVAPTTAYNAIRIQPSTGTISGNFVVYGVKF